VNAVLLKPLPVADPDRLVMLATASAASAGDSGYNPTVSPSIFAHLRNQADVLQQVTAIGQDDVMNYTGSSVLEQWRLQRASADFFSCLGFRIIRGRAFNRQEDAPGGPLVALLGQTLWTRRFAADASIVGKTVDLNGSPYTVIGIVADNPAMLEFGSYADVYVPYGLDPNSSDHGRSFIAAARLKPGVSLQQARQRLNASTRAFEAKFPHVLGQNEHFTAIGAYDFLVTVNGGARVLLVVLLTAVVLVLLIACANVASLSLIRVSARSREIAVRLAMGAGRRRIVRLLLTESLLLSLAGGAPGLALGYAGIRALMSAYAVDLKRTGEAGAGVLLDWRVAAFAVALSLVATILCGSLPALRGARLDLNIALKDGAAPLAGRRCPFGGSRWKQSHAALVTGEAALAVILLVGSGLLIRTFAALYKVDRGFDARNVVTMKVLLTGSKYTKPAEVNGIIRNALDRIRTLPGVAAASTTCCVPLQGQNDILFEIPGRTVADPRSLFAGWTTVSPGFFDVFHIPIMRGRAFTERDTAGSQPVVLINETMARAYWKGRDPLRDRIIIGRNVMKEFQHEPPRQIIGVVGDVRDSGLDRAPRPVMYVPQAQPPDTTDTFWNQPIAWVVRTRTPPRPLAPAIQEQLRQAIGLPVSDLLLMDEVVSLSTAQQRFSMLLMSIFGGSALLLSVVGIYGLIAFTIRQRTREIGIRMAIGADGVQVRSLFIKQGMALTGIGIAIGIVAAWALSRSLESFLFGVQARDPFVFGAVPLCLSLAALIAIWLPASRALRVDPAEALRSE
jgi:predicted permease